MSSDTLSSAAFHDRRRAVVAPSIAVGCPHEIVRGEGSYLVTREGARLIDFTTGIAVMNVGHAHPKVTAAIAEAAAQGTHFCFQVMGYDGYVRLAERLVALMPTDDMDGTPVKWKVALFNSGAEAVENAIKIARLATGRMAIAAFEHAFHGRTYGALSLTSKPAPYRQGFGPFLPEVVRLPYPTQYRCAGCPSVGGGCDCTATTLARIDQVFATQTPGNEIAAVFMEPIVGEGGFYVPPPGFMAKLAELCRRYGILLVVDEIQTGIARTGTMFRFEAEDVVPDLLLTAKALGGGMPLSGVVGRAEILDKVHPGGLGGTYAGNPVAVAAAHAVLDIVEEESLRGEARRKGARAKEVLRGWQDEIPQVGDVRGAGLMLAVEFVKDRATREPLKSVPPKVVARCYERGLAVLSAGTYGNCIRLLPALNIPDDVLEEGLRILSEVVREVVREETAGA